ncbi:MAG: hypothetical protein AAFX50_14565, partial [Acidobacteriota bacterium]
ADVSEECIGVEEACVLGNFRIETSPLLVATQDFSQGLPRVIGVPRMRSDLGAQGLEMPLGDVSIAEDALDIQEIPMQSGRHVFELADLHAEALDHRAGEGVGPSDGGGASLDGLGHLRRGGATRRRRFDSIPSMPGSGGRRVGVPGVAMREAPGFEVLPRLGCRKVLGLSCDFHGLNLQRVSESIGSLAMAGLVARQALASTRLKSVDRARPLVVLSGRRKVRPPWGRPSKKI